MSVYIDNAFMKYGRMIMCHMVADSREELLAMADEIGLNRKWIQSLGTSREHFDVGMGMRKLAVRAGAKEITKRELALFLHDKRAAESTV